MSPQWSSVTCIAGLGALVLFISGVDVSHRGNQILADHQRDLKRNRPLESKQLFSSMKIQVNADDKKAEDADTKFFREEVEPIFKDSCQRCHGEKKQESSLRMDSREALLKGGKNGPTIVPGKPDESLLMKVLEYTGDIQMPPDAKLDEDKQEAIKKWIEKNAPWPKRS